MHRVYSTRQRQTETANNNRAPSWSPLWNECMDRTCVCVWWVQEYSLSASEEVTSLGSIDVSLTWMPLGNKPHAMHTHMWAHPNINKRHNGCGVFWL